MATLFAVAWLLKVCLGAKCMTTPAPAQYACEMKAAALVVAAPESWKLTAECLTVRGDKAGA